LGRDRRGQGRVDGMDGWNSLLAFPMVILETILLLSREKSLEECPDLIF